MQIWSEFLLFSGFLFLRGGLDQLARAKFVVTSCNYSAYDKINKCSEIHVIFKLCDYLYV